MMRHYGAPFLVVFPRKLPIRKACAMPMGTSDSAFITSARFSCTAAFISCSRAMANGCDYAVDRIANRNGDPKKGGGEPPPGSSLRAMTLCYGCRRKRQEIGFSLP